MEKSSAPDTRRSSYIAMALKNIGKNGDVCATENRLYDCCRQAVKQLSYEAFKTDLAEQIHKGIIHAEGEYLYDAKTWRYEEYAAADLARRKEYSPLPTVVIPETVEVGDIILCEEQRKSLYSNKSETRCRSNRFFRRTPLSYL